MLSEEVKKAMYIDILPEIRPTWTETMDTKEDDIVVANILADVIIPLSAVIRPFMKKDGVFIISGIIDTKENAVKAALTENGFEIEDVLHMGEWVSIVAKCYD